MLGNFPLHLCIFSLEMKSEVIRTNDDAVSCRVSAVALGYLQDPFVTLLDSSQRTTSSKQRKSPLMNRGTYIRTKGIDHIILEQLRQEETSVQIVSLGAGSDSRYFRLSSQYPDLMKNVFYTELDYPEVTSKKTRLIYKHKDQLLSQLIEPSLSKQARDCDIT